MSPGAHTGDGSTDLIIVRKTHHVNYLRYLVRSVMLVVVPLMMKHLIVVNYLHYLVWSVQTDTPA